MSLADQLRELIVPDVPVPPTKIAAVIEGREVRMGSMVRVRRGGVDVVGEVVDFAREGAPWMKLATVEGDVASVHGTDGVELIEGGRSGRSAR